MGQTWSTFLVPGLPSLCNVGGSWSMIAAAREGDHRHLVEYASQEPLLLLACSLKGFSLAHTAADAGSTSTLQLLIELMHQHAQDLSARLQEVLDWGSNGAEVLKNLRSSEQEEQMARLLNPDLVLPTLLSWQDVKGVTPLMLAGRGGHADCMKLLLQHGADPLLLDGINRRSCLHYAAGAGHTRCVNILLNEFVTVLQPAAQQQQQPRLVLLADAVVQDTYRGSTSFVDLRTRTGFSALHYATFWGFVDCVQALLTAGACINQALINPSRQHSELPVINGCTPLHLAADCGHTALAALLLQAHVTRTAASSRAPATSHQEWLRWEGVPHQDPRLRRNASGDTPITLAENRCNSSEVMRMLLDPHLPINRVLPAVLEVCFGGPPRFGVTRLAVLAKSALDTHLTSTLNQLEQQQKQQQEQQQQQQLLLLDKAEVEEEEQQEQQPVLPVGLTLSGLVADDDDVEEEVPPQPKHQCLADLEDVTEQLGAPDIFGGNASNGDAGAATCRCGSCFGSPASQSTSYCSINGLGNSRGSSGSASSSSLASALERSNSGDVSGVGGCSACSASCIDSTFVQGPFCNNPAAYGTHARTLSIDSAIAESAAASVTDRTCAICFDASATIMMAGCCHCVCVSCARSLLDSTTVSKPALCPFCRGGLSGFVAALPVS